MRALPSQARSLFVRNRDEDVIASVRPLLSAGAQDEASGDALIVAGLASIRLGQEELGAAFFDVAYHSAPTAALRSASAFWAGRIAQRRGDRGAFAVWMRRAALEGDTFYAMIARRALGPTAACLTGATIGNA